MKTLFISIFLYAIFSRAFPSQDRIEGLLYGTFIGDAAGGPLEFAPARRSEITEKNSPLNETDLKILSARYQMLPYEKPAAPYAAFKDNAPAGTITDDSRHKLLILRALKIAGSIKKLSSQQIASAYLSYRDDRSTAFYDLRQEWLQEYGAVALWELGERNPKKAFPADRLWGGLPTVYGSMAFLPLAALFSNPEKTYLNIWNLDFFETGIGKDFSAAIVAGLNFALQSKPGDWQGVENTIRNTDPYQFAKAPWIPRSVNAWLDKSDEIRRYSKNIPSQLFSNLENNLSAVVWWESWIAPTVIFSLQDIAKQNPFAALQTLIEFGHDTDSYGQLMGAYLGAFYGKELYPKEMRDLINFRLQEEMGTDVPTLTQEIMKAADWLKD